MSPARTNSQLSEQLIQDSFHSYLKSSLSQAKAEHLLDADVLSSAEGDLMITGPALCLYFAALRCTTNPPSVPLPRSSKSASGQPTDLSYDNCPPAFVSFLHVWAKTVPSIQALAPEYQHDLARVICGLDPITQPIHASINGIAADLRAVAIEISQRRSFQDRYASDLQAALDAGGTPSPRKASFVPPPIYVPDSPSASSFSSLPRPQSPGLLSPSTAQFPARSHSPTILAPDSPAIEFIRETLYASLADALERLPSLRRLLSLDPPRAYFAAVAFAVLDVATTSITPDGAVVGVLGTPLTLEQCPAPLRPFMAELAAIGAQAKAVEEEDNESAMRLAERGESIPATRMERVRVMLEGGIGADVGDVDGRRSVEGRAVAFVNRINALSLGLTRLKAFRERQDEVFRVLKSIGEL
ncbi:hypothetical protein K443DRAFT_113988 [Laccaria amethystina LaAM-08-1]|uniref:Uncharacterized protein n=1 Tax=Laccaria amethystina LaAM-08-1 TaxID=1095629 RepID=A0A0C9WI20_9AGAR|nr:hypothetical protein K443DRAFT_113988 [Laccaria amethystina LaAM-08-1]